jgi:hypothetical protein
MGAVIINVLLEVLRDPADSRYVFYALVVVGLLAVMRPWPRLAAVLGGTMAFGFAVHAVAGSISGRAVNGTVDGGWLGDAISHWVIVPVSVGSWAQVAYVALVAAALLLTLVRGNARSALLVPTLYLAAFVWENVMAEQPEPTRFVVLGLILIATMIVRPNGILGEKRVEIV